MVKSQYCLLVNLSATANKCKLPAGTNVENPTDCNSDGGGCSVADLITSASSVSCAPGYSGIFNVHSSPKCNSDGAEFSGAIAVCAGEFADLASTC